MVVHQKRYYEKILAKVERQRQALEQERADRYVHAFHKRSARLAEMCDGCLFYLAAADLRRCKNDDQHGRHCPDCHVDGECKLFCALHCAASGCAKWASVREREACEKCRRTLCLDHVQFCTHCGSAFCLDDRLACISTHTCEQGKKRQKKE